MNGERGGVPPPGTHTSELGHRSGEEPDATALVSPLPLPRQILALDVGSRRIGVAISDPLGIAAHPLLTVHRTTERADIRSVARLIRRHNIAEVVVGDPVHLSGEPGAQTGKARRFAQALRAQTEVAVHLLDERLTTAEAHTLLDRTKPRVTSRDARRRREAVIDQVAAVLLLEAFLSNRSPRLLPPPSPEPDGEA